MKRILLLVVLSLMSMVAIAQHNSTPKRGISVVAGTNELFLVSIQSSADSEAGSEAVSQWRYKKAKKGMQYRIDVELKQPQIADNKASFELMMGKDPMELVVYANTEKDELRIMTRKSYDRMVREKKAQEIFEQKRQAHILEHQHPHSHEE